MHDHTRSLDGRPCPSSPSAAIRNGDQPLLPRASSRRSRAQAGKLNPWGELRTGMKLGGQGQPQRSS
jgi:hypothetical protein